MNATLHGPVVHAESRLDQPSLIWRTGQWTRGDLRVRVRSTAKWLQAQHVGASKRVAVSLPKSAEAVQTMLAIMASGAAAVPLDVNAPPARLARVLERLEPSLLVTTPAMASELQRFVPAVQQVEPSPAGDGLDALVRGYTDVASDFAEDRDAPALLLSTSGSTGEPKGIVLTHGNVRSFTDWATERLALTSADRFLSYAPLHFDLSTLDIYASFSVGARVYLLDEPTSKLPPAVARLVQDQRITVWYSVPTALRLLCEHGRLHRTDMSSLRLVLFAGEVFPVPALRALMQALPRPAFYNLYGPTETNVCTYYRVPPDIGNVRAIPIGRPCEHLEVDICDEDGRPLPRGELGEICVAGPAVMQGYFRAEEATRRARWQPKLDSYRTGDFGRWLDDGNIEFSGRRDHQVKVRGYRVELGDVESALVQHPGVSEAAVVAARPEDGENVLFAFVLTAKSEVTAESIHAHASALLARGAVPQHFFICDHFPRTSTGKIDRDTLAARAHAALKGTDP